MYQKTINLLALGIIVIMGFMIVDNSYIIEKMRNNYDRDIAYLKQVNENHDKHIIDVIEQLSNDTQRSILKNIDSSVKIYNNLGTGSGTIIYSELYDASKDMTYNANQPEKEHKKYTSYVLTVAHLFPKDQMDMIGDIVVEIVLSEDEQESLDAYIIYIDRDFTNDCAILYMESDELLSHSMLSSQDELDHLEYYSDIYYVGFPLGKGPNISEGLLISRGRNSDDYFWGSNALALFGNSGGGVFCKTHHKLIGVVTGIDGYNVGFMKYYANNLSYFNSIANIAKRVSDSFPKINFLFE